MSLNGLLQRAERRVLHKTHPGNISKKVLQLVLKGIRGATQSTVETNVGDHWTTVVTTRLMLNILSNHIPSIISTIKHTWAELGKVLTG